MSSRALHLHTCSSHAFEPFPRCPFCIPALRSPPVAFSSFLSGLGIKHFQIGPRLAKRPWFTTGRPPVKFRVISTSFDTPTVNRGTEKASCVLQPNTPQIWPKTHQTLLHRLGRSITIVWAKTAPHLDSPSSLYLYICIPPEIIRSPNPKNLLPSPPDTSSRSRTESRCRAQPPRRCHVAPATARTPRPARPAAGPRGPRSRAPASPRAAATPAVPPRRRLAPLYKEPPGPSPHHRRRSSRL